MSEFDDLLTRLDEAHAEEQKFNRETFGEREFDPDEGTLYSEAAEAIRALTAGEYEYAMGMGAEAKPVGDVMDRYDRKPVWTDKKSAQGLVDWYTKEYTHEEFKLLKRRKAGKVEIV